MPHRQAAKEVAEKLPEINMAALEPLLGDAPSASLLTFAAKCKEVLNNGYSEGKKFPKSQAHEAECVAACCTGGPTVLRELKLAFCHLHSGPPPAPSPPAGWGAAMLALWGEVLRIFCNLNQPSAADSPALEEAQPVDKAVLLQARPHATASPPCLL